MKTDVKTGTPEWDVEEDPDFTLNQSSAEQLLQTWKESQVHFNHFWKAWSEDYLLSLRERHRNPKLKSGRTTSTESISTGDVVLLHETLPRGTWKLATVKKLIRSKDLQIRSAELMLPSKKTLTRPLNLLYPLECSTAKPCENDSTVKDATKGKNPSRDDNALPTTSAVRPRRRAAVKARELLQRLEPYL
jgi:hypothetical protein